MAKSSKKAAAAAAPVVAVQDKKSAKKGKRAPEEAVEKVVNAKKQKSQKDEASAAKKKLEAKTVKKKKVEPTSDDSDVESDEEPAKGKSKAKAPSKKAAKKTPAKKAEPSDSSDGSDSDESEEEENVVTASAPKKVVSDEGSSDSESEEEVSEEEKKPAAKSAPKAGARKKVDESESESDGSEGSDSDDDNSDEESEEEEPVKVSKKKGTDVDMVDAATPKKANGKSENAPKTPATAEGGSKTLFVGNLSFNVEQSDVEAFFKDVGEIVEVRFASAPDGTFKGFGHVEFATSEEAQKALEMNGMDLSGRPVKLDLARERGAATPRSSNFPTGDSHSVFIRGFDKNLGEEEARSSLQEHFGACGEMTRCSIPVDRESGCIKGSFTRHVTHLLSEQEIEDLSSRKWRYQWEVPAFDSSNWKWKGTGDCLLKDAEPIMSYGLKHKLYKQWLDIYKASGGNDFHSSKQRIFFSLCNSYRDILHHNKKAFYLKGLHEDSSMMDAYIMHSLNHVFKCRDVVMKNEARLAKDHETGKDEVLSNNIYLDRGFCRPKVLILLPLASIALRVVKRLIQLTPSGNKVNVQHMDRFTNEFGVANIENVDDDLPLENGAEFENMMPQKPTKPSDFEALFGGNNNDHFMVGIKFTRKSIKLYGDFYTSDLIVASPLGLITKIEEAEIEKDKDVDYLSSIEILVIDHADVITMQNWSHVTTVLQHLNQLPSKNHGDDIMRVRQWYLDGQARFYRQSIILSSYITPEINALFNQQCANYEGKLKLSCEYKGILPKVVLQVRQIYERFPVDSLVDADDARFEYFIKKVFSKIKDTTQGGIMIFISSYFEFVRVRNFLKSQDSSFCLLGEYTKQSDISRARVWFFQGTRQIMLYTERAHFYHRYKIRGIKNLIIYSLPERKEFYPELVNMLQESHDMSCTVLFSRFDQFRLERIVGNTAAKRLVTSEKDLFLFC